MKPPRQTGTPDAILGDSVNRLIRKFDYPDENTRSPAFVPGGGGGMAHVLIVSTSEPQSVQDKADYVVTQATAGTELNAIFSTLTDGPWSIWMAGVFNLDTDVVSPPSAWIRGLGFTDTGGVPV